MAKRFYRVIVPCVLLGIAATSLLAEHTRRWRQSTYEEFQKGKAQGVAVRSDGHLELAPKFSLLADADAGKGGLGLMLKDDKFRKDLGDTLSQVNILVTGINKGQGTLGKLATDDAAYVNLNKLLVASTDLVTTIRSDPKKYLTIHMKIF